MIDVFIIGKGPAGISASLYAVRGGFSVTATGKDAGALGKTEKIENYYGFAEPISGAELFNNGINGAERLGVDILDEEVFDISYDGTFKITTDKNTYEAKSVILASGAVRKTPPVKGLKEYEGRGVSYCAVCDAFFYRNSNVAVIGNGRYALNEAAHLLPTSGLVALLTNGRELASDTDIKDFCIKNKINLENKDNIINTVNDINEDSFAETENGCKFIVIKEKIDEIRGSENGTVDSVRFSGGKDFSAEGVFIAEGAASGADLGRKLGAADADGKLMLNDDMSTFVPGFFAAGDCTGGTLQIAKAVYEGMLAGTAAVKFLRG